MKKNSFINILFFNFSFFQVIIYFSNYLFKESLSYCSFNSTNLDNIINVEKQNFRYVNFATYSNGDMVFLTTEYKEGTSAQNTRIFYGLKKNGRPLFNDSYFYSKETNNYAKWESESLVVKESGNCNNKTEYLMSFSKNNLYVEVYNFTNGIIYRKKLQNFLNSTIISYRHAFISLFSNDSNYFYLLGFINNNKEFVIQKHLFKSLENIENENTINKTIIINNIKAKTYLSYPVYQ